MPDFEKPVHPAADQGYTRSADTYVRGRPDYPAKIASWLTDTLGVGEASRVVDLGAGTGKFTRYLLQTGAHVIAIEPVASMRTALATYAPGATIMEGTAVSLALEDESVDAVVCAQSFHWFSSTEALDEIHRVLRPGGRLALVWNKRDTRHEWVRQLDDIVNAYEADTPRFHTGQWRNAFPHPGFGALQETRFAHGHTGTIEDVIISRSLSTSFIAALPTTQRTAVKARILTLIDRTPELKDHDQITFPYETLAYCTQRR